MRPGLTLYVVRHGETDWNLAGRLQGQTDIPLNDTGRGQAQRNGLRLKQELGGCRETIDFIASPLGRAYETMQILRRAIGLPGEGFATDDRLKEISYGLFEGRTWQQLPPIDSVGVARASDPFNWRPDGGESYGDLAERARGWLGDIERDAVIVTHGGITRVLRGLVLGIGPDRVPTLKVPQDRILVLRAGEMTWM